MLKLCSAKVLVLLVSAGVLTFGVVTFTAMPTGIALEKHGAVPPPPGSSSPSARAKWNSTGQQINNKHTGS